LFWVYRCLHFTGINLKLTTCITP